MFSAACFVWSALQKNSSSHKEIKPTLKQWDVLAFLTKTDEFCAD